MEGEVVETGPAGDMQFTVAALIAQGMCLRLTDVILPFPICRSRASLLITTDFRTDLMSLAITPEIGKIGWWRHTRFVDLDG